ncbi:hypothetical protein VOLCADRAFT_100133 [Volvox carteri f. nagariensis]|uniref:Uncharacterized protein n=1 Tax=Volvox carteri f. nagariensis TaxID=3068 RepID=D8UJH7_VOLCA|nr:uncharacterized protein VOLCADRAFT_100133 [Volvox carteri f. nagariensis]EFJ40125.1 hypothetical protein VOLCADRAFT_100133 [Volvox carteri f. nagariensis]|eukprot:XP_002958821.1 hypothetical protein VOLCADRAFT_100133 [Volvox carteri f. nagariensis]
MPKATELSLGDDGYAGVPASQQQIPPEGEGSIPAWYAEEWATRTRWRHMGNQVARDTAALAGVMLLMDGVEGGMRRLRAGSDDPWNRVMAGVMAGGLLGLLWYPGHPRGRAYMTAAGSFVGYFSYVTEKAVDSRLLTTQRELEAELLQKSEDQLRQELSRPYLQSLLRAKQRMMHEAARKAMAEKLAHTPATPYVPTPSIHSGIAGPNTANIAPTAPFQIFAIPYHHLFMTNTAGMPHSYAYPTSSLSCPLPDRRRPCSSLG